MLRKNEIDFLNLLRLQRLYLCIRSNGCWKVLHDDGKAGGGPRGHNTPDMQGLVQQDRGELNGGLETLGRGQLHGDLLRARPGSPEPQEQGKSPGQGAPAPRALRRGPLQARGHVLRRHS